jgi:Abortive infection alpha
MADPLITGAISTGRALEKAADSAPGPPVSAHELNTGELAPETLDYLTRASGGPLGELWAIPGDWIRFRRWKRAVKRAEEARRILADRGREPRQVDDSTLVPLLEAANLTDDDTLAAKWAALLANATDPAADPVLPVHAEILKQLSPDDAILLDHIVVHGTPHVLKMPLTMRSLDIGVLQRTGPIKNAIRFRIAIDNLLRLRVLVEIVQQQRQSTRATTNDLSLGGVPKLSTTLRISALGAAFVRAVSLTPEVYDIEQPTVSPMRVNPVD